MSNVDTWILGIVLTTFYTNRDEELKESETTVPYLNPNPMFPGVLYPVVLHMPIRSLVNSLGFCWAVRNLGVTSSVYLEKDGRASKDTRKGMLGCVE